MLFVDPDLAEAAPAAERAARGVERKGPGDEFPVAPFARRAHEGLQQLPPEASTPADSVEVNRKFGDPGVTRACPVGTRPRPSDDPATVFDDGYREPLLFPQPQFDVAFGAWFGFERGAALSDPLVVDGGDGWRVTAGCGRSPAPRLVLIGTTDRRPRDRKSMALSLRVTGDRPSSARGGAPSGSASRR